MAESTSSRPSQPSRRLGKDDVVRGALALLNEIGIDALSTRRLAEYLGVRSPTLYWHFPSKEALLEAMAESVMLERQAAQQSPPAGAYWKDWFIENAVSFRAALLAYRDGARLHAGSRPRPGQFDSIEARVAALRQAGFEPGEAVRLMMSAGRFVVGWVLEEQATRMDDGHESPVADHHPLLQEGWATLAAMDPDAAFVDAVSLLADGAEAAMRRRKGD